MKKSRQIWSPLFGLLFLTIFSAPPVLADEETTANLYLNGGQYWFDSDRLDGTPLEGFKLRDTTGGGIGYGYSMTDRWAMEGVVDYFSVSVKGIDEKVDVYNYHLDLFYHFLGRFCGNECWQPYVAFGVGEVRVDYRGDDDHYYGDDYGDNYDDYDYDWHDRQTMVNLGLGIKYQLGPRWQARGDLRAFQGIERGGLDGFLSVAIGYQWYEYTRVVRDYDGDGVFEGMDRCPQTPPGIQVLGDGCPTDVDYDGVPDYIDVCPGTPRGIAVDENGCRKP
ncbi:outer membrane beta-barrel protein [Microbulbifer litoralis]|uniref:outer membrane beta-barrel protein n=1 Tax=Microbulbifer litoralis TaxID=2933965 RepID=UPI0020297A39|nr:outer membrane beta-barrel protein [Microbulbifer sp. GX H0434]